MIYLIALLVLLIPLWFIGYSIAPWFPMKRRDLTRVNRLAALKPGETFVELGSGDGRVCLYIAQKNPDCTVVGIEMALIIYLLSRVRLVMSPQKNLTLLHKNALKHDLRSADVVYTFASIHSINTKLKEKFLADLRPGARIISYVFSIKSWNGEQFTDKPDKKSEPIHVYTMFHSASRVPYHQQTS